MHRLPLDHPALHWVNVAELERGGDGLIPLRFPRAVIAGFDGMIPIARMSTGIELQLPAAVTAAEFAVRLLDDDGYGLQAEVYRGPFKVLPTWRLRAGCRTTQRARFELVNRRGADYPVRLLFPTHVVPELVDLRVQTAAGADLAAPFAPYDYRGHAAGRRLTWLVQGDSITQGANVSCPSGTWVDLTARRLALKPVNLGIGGHGKAEPAMARYLASRSDHDLLGLHIGANCARPGEAEAFLARFAALLDAVRAARPALPIVVGTPIPHFSDEDPPPDGRAMQMPLVRDGLTAECAHRQAAGDAHLYVVDGRALLDGIAGGLLADGVHIHDFAAAVISERLAAHLAPILAREFPA